MLNLNIRDNLSPVLKQLITDFRRVQVSRFPIDVIQHPNDDVESIKFVDSRFPTDTWRKDRILAYLSINGIDSKMRPKLMLYSRLIQNDKYNRQNDEYRQKITTDPKKMASWLREYVKPYSPEEIMERSPGHVQYDYNEWQYTPRNEFRAIAQRLSTEDIAEEIMYLQSVGVQFRSEKFQRVATEGLELYAEAQRRTSKVVQHVHVFVQPDGSVLLTAPSQGGLSPKAVQYDSMEQVPEVIQQQVAMLRLCEVGHYIPEVGRMSVANNFWVHVNPSDWNN